MIWAWRNEKYRPVRAVMSVGTARQTDNKNRLPWEPVFYIS